jgi:hypothetical protein
MQKHKLYPWMLGFFALAVISAPIAVFFLALAMLANLVPSAGLASLQWTSGDAFAAFLSIVLGAAVLCGIMMAGMATLAFGYVAELGKPPVPQMEKAEDLAMAHAA